MRELTHADEFAVLPPRMHRQLDEPRTAARMTKDDLWTAVEWMTRLLGEARRRDLPDDLYARLDVARAVGLGMYSTAEPSGFSVRVPVEVRS